MIEIRRNDPCPCGSGRKYKHCCYMDNERKYPDKYLIYDYSPLITAPLIPTRKMWLEGMVQPHSPAPQKTDFQPKVIQD